jgi:hypothetical protein
MSAVYAHNPGKPCLCRAHAAEHMLQSACAHGCASRAQGRRRVLGQPEAAVVWRRVAPDPSQPSNRSASGSGAPWGKWGPAARQLAAARARAVAGAAAAGRGPRRRLLAAAGDADGVAAAGTAAEPAGRSGGPARELAPPSQVRSSGQHCRGPGHEGPCLRLGMGQHTMGCFPAVSDPCPSVSGLMSSCRCVCGKEGHTRAHLLAEALFACVALPGQQPFAQPPQSGQ